MREEWKSELFKSESDKPPKQLIYPMSVASGRRILGVCHETWKRWEPIALGVPEYKFIQQRMKKLASKHKGFPPINAYQVWVMGKIGELFDNMPDGLPKAWMVEESVKGDQDQFTRKAFEEEQARYTSMLLTA